MMKAGRYWIGDLCYVLGNRWDEVCDIVIDGHTCLSGEFELNGVPFAMYSTAYGDGVYSDTDMRSYPVDSGSIGCVLLDDIDDGADITLGNIIEFSHDFVTSASDGTIQFGEIEIITSNFEDEEEEEWMEDEYDEE
jgi:hypothetical protein